MKLLRLALVSFSNLPEDWKKWTATIGGVRLGTLHCYEEDKGVKLLVIAEGELKHFPKVTAQGLVVIPENLRKQLERAIETMSNIISISIGSKRTIASPTPSIALVPEDDEEKERLLQAKGFLYPKGNRMEPGASFEIPEITQFLKDLQDRMEGVALLAESIAHGHITGKFHEYMRLFERAFRVSSKRLITPLSDFLGTSQFGYTAKEVENWILNFRHPITHADEREHFLLESDVRPVIRRMEQAAYDVLFNKETWRNQESGRRKVWVPAYGTTSTNGDIFITQGRDVKLTGVVVDEFHAYCMDLQGILKAIPPEWWAPPPVDSAPA